MTVSDLLIAKDISPGVAFHKFGLLVSNYSEDLFCFFEGKDAPYYCPRIDNNFNGNYHPINCKGKSNLLKAFQLIEEKPEYKKYKKKFFIDRDFDESIKNKFNNLYETPTYSIENFYSGIETFKRILKSEFDLTEIDKEFQVCINLYKDRQDEFHDATLLFNAWYACIKAKAMKLGKSTNVNLDETLPTGFVLIKLEGVESTYNLDKIKSTFSDALEFEEKDLEEKVVEFKNCERRRIFRGKYELQFVYVIIKSLVNDANDKSKRKYLSKKTKLNLDKAQIISQLSQYAETPNCLNEFLKG